MRVTLIHRSPGRVFRIRRQVARARLLLAARDNTTAQCIAPCVERVFFMFVREERSLLPGADVSRITSYAMSVNVRSWDAR